MSTVSKHITDDPETDDWKPRYNSHLLRGKREHSPSPTRMEIVTMAGVEVWHYAGGVLPGTSWLTEPMTKYRTYRITGGINDAIRVAQWIARPRVKVTDRHLIGSWIDVTHLVIDLTNAYGACRPALLDQKQVDRITSFFGMR